MNSTAHARAESRPSVESTRAPLAVLHGTSNDAARRARNVNDRWLIAFIVCCGLLAAALANYVASPAITTLAGAPEDTWTQAP